MYVWRQRDTEVVAEYLNSHDVNGGVVIYHGGMDARARSKSQSKVRQWRMLPFLLFAMGSSDDVTF